MTVEQLLYTLTHLPKECRVKVSAEAERGYTLNDLQSVSLCTMDEGCQVVVLESCRE